MQSSSDAVITITDLETLKVISDPLRLKIFRKIGSFNLAGELCTVKQVSDELGLPAARLYYHFKLMESHGLLEVAETHVVSGIVEKRYRVPAIRISISDELLDREGQQNTFYPVFAEVINEMLDDLRQALQSRKTEKITGNFTLTQHTLKLPPNMIDTVSARMEEFIQLIEKELQAKAGGELVDYSLFFSCFPKPPRPASAKSDTS
ncbi:MAG: helix-turn-helix domain-containing protein, partial [Anaerolineaceae bacterium]